MKKLFVGILCASMLITVASCDKKTDTPNESGNNGKTETLTGVGEGYGGPVTVTVKKEGDKIISVDVVGDKETNGIGTNAIEQLPAKIVEANSTDVDVISGATVTSNAILYAVNNALDPEKYPAPTPKVEEEKEPEVITASDLYQGFGLSNMHRIGPGADDQEVPVYSFNQVFANTLFDENGKILSLYVDVIEVATPNYDGEGMPQFSGFPGQGGYNYDEDHDGKVDGKTEDSEDNYVAELSSWVTKRERGEAYKMGTGSWAAQMDKFQETFVGMTVEEVEDWFEKYTSDVNGRPLKADSSNEDDKAKYDALSEEEKTMLADVVSGATMSLKDPHGDIIAAIKNSYENRVPLDVKKAASKGTAFVNTPRIGPGADDQEVPVYSFNEVFANALFDEEGRILSLYVDILEVATPNYDGEGMPQFSGFPGQGGYNYDENHDGTVDGKTEDTEDNFAAELAGWVTKRQRGESYKMGTGSWASQMDKFQETFIGMTVEEVEDWFEKYTSDVNGRPLKADSSNEDDKAKYDALSEEEKTMLADVVSGATMSLKDPHGDIIAAIKKAYENRIQIDLTVE